MKIVINKHFGGFGLTKAVYDELGIEWDGYGLQNEQLGINSNNYYAYRADKRLIEAIEEIGIEASGDIAALEIVEIPDDIEWEIDDHNGIETVREIHRSGRNENKHIS